MTLIGYMLQNPSYVMAEVTEDIEEIKKDNERIIMKTFGLDYEKYFSQERPDEN